MIRTSRTVLWIIRKNRIAFWFRVVWEGNLWIRWRIGMRFRKGAVRMISVGSGEGGDGEGLGPLQLLPRCSKPQTLLQELVNQETTMRTISRKRNSLIRNLEGVMVWWCNRTSRLRIGRGSMGPLYWLMTRTNSHFAVLINCRMMILACSNWIKISSISIQTNNQTKSKTTYKWQKYSEQIAWPKLTWSTTASSTS